jgi:cell division protein FtsB
VSRRALGTAAVVVLAVGLVVYGGNGVARVWQMRRELEALERDLTTLRARHEQLAATVDRLRHDPAYIEKLAREEMGMVRAGETVLKFPSAPARSPGR